MAREVGVKLFDYGGGGGDGGGENDGDEDANYVKRKYLKQSKDPLHE